MATAKWYPLRSQGEYYAAMMVGDQPTIYIAKMGVDGSRSMEVREAQDQEEAFQHFKEAKMRYDSGTGD